MRGQLPVRLWVMAGDENSALEASLPRYRTIGRGGNFLTVRSIKRLVDGALGSRGAWLLRPYDDLPSSCGLNTLDLDDLHRTAEIAIANDCQLCVHAIGDRANREVLDLYDAHFRMHGDRRDLRWRSRTRSTPGPDRHAAIRRVGCDRGHAGRACDIRWTFRRHSDWTAACQDRRVCLAELARSGCRHRERYRRAGRTN